MIQRFLELQLHCKALKYIGERLLEAIPHGNWYVQLTRLHSETACLTPDTP